MANESDTDKEKLVNIHGLETFKSYADSYYTPKQNLDNTIEEKVENYVDGKGYATKDDLDELASDVPTVTLNGSKTTSASFYAPTSAGTADGQVVKWDNTNKVPTWGEAGNSLPFTVTLVDNGNGAFKIHIS